jgi:N-methylhydantoinase B
MNNVTIGGWDANKGRSFTYYETIGGGIGARMDAHGPSAMHSHMTNTLNTPVEALEYAYPLQVIQYCIREKSSGSGVYSGGDGIIREIMTLVDAQVTLLTERRRLPPYGLSGGQPGSPGENLVIKAGKVRAVKGKGTTILNSGDRLVIKTPGGGGYGADD